MLRIFQVKLFQLYPFKYLTIFYKYLVEYSESFSDLLVNPSQTRLFFPPTMPDLQNLETSPHLGLYLAPFSP